IRYILNLGHTLGHALELNWNMSHGEAVLFGIAFSLEWSRHLNFLSETEYQKICNTHLFRESVSQKKGRVLTVAKLKKLLSQDKKITDHSQLFFVFIKRIGVCQVKKV